jgi:hypothetical protein
MYKTVKANGPFENEQMCRVFQWLSIYHSTSGHTVVVQIPDRTNSTGIRTFTVLSGQRHKCSAPFKGEVFGYYFSL